jgi:hypothetical protein
MVYHNNTLVECLLNIETEVFTFDHTYHVSLSTNFGLQWIHAFEYPVQTIEIPDIHRITPNRISSNLLSKIHVSLTRTAQEQHPRLSLQGFEILSQEQGDRVDELVLVLRPLDLISPD